MPYKFREKNELLVFNGIKFVSKATVNGASTD